MDIAQTLLEPAAQRCATVDAALAGELAQLDEAIQAMVSSALPAAKPRVIHVDRRPGLAPSGEASRIEAATIHSNART